MEQLKEQDIDACLRKRSVIQCCRILGRNTD